MAQTKTQSSRSEKYIIYIFAANGKYLRSVFKNDYLIQFENIKQYLRSELNKYSIAEISEDGRSMTVKSSLGTDFSNTYELAEKISSVFERIKTLLKDIECGVVLKAGIITEEEIKRRHPFIWNLPYDTVRSLPDILLSSKTAMSIIENYDMKDTSLRNIWITDGVMFSTNRKLKNIYFDRDETEDIQNFLETDDKVLYIYGEKGSGKTSLIKDFIKNFRLEKNILFFEERKHSVKEFRTVHDLLYNLLFPTESGDPLSLDEVVRKVENSSLPNLNKANLVYFSSVISGESQQDRNIRMEYGTYRDNLKRALNDVLKIVTKDIVLIIDDHQWMSKNCWEILADILKPEYKNQIILISNDKNCSTGIFGSVKYLCISELNKVQISRLLRMVFPRIKIPARTADFIHKVTGGNLYTALEFVQFMMDKKYVVTDDGKLEVSLSDMSQIPDDLSDIYAQKISALSKEALSLLKIISVMEDRFFLSDLDWLLHTLNFPHDEIIALAELEDRGIIENRGAHYLITEPCAVAVLYKNMNANNRKLIHELLAQLFTSKGYNGFVFKIFIHYYRSENHKELMNILEDMTLSSVDFMNYNALKNMLELSDRMLFNLCVKENEFPVENWIKNIKCFKWLFDTKDPVRTLIVYEKAADYLIKTEKPEFLPEIVCTLLDLYIRASKFKKFVYYWNLGSEYAEKNPSSMISYKLAVQNAVYKIRQKIEVTENDFIRISELKTAVGEEFYCPFHDTVAAHIAECKGQTDRAIEIYRKILDLRSRELNFSETASVIYSLVGLNMKVRNYRSAEDFLKQLIVIKKDSSFSDLIQLNILLARLYSYQNKFLQSVSLIESVSAGCEDKSVSISLTYILGSIYQFYGEKEMSLKTFDIAEKKFKRISRDLIRRLTVKRSLVHAYFKEYGYAQKKLSKLKVSPFIKMLRKIYSIGENGYNDNDSESVINSFLDKSLSNEDHETVFEAGFIFLMILFSQRKKDKSQALHNILYEMQDKIEDYNLILEFNKLTKKIFRRSNSPGKKPVPAKSMSVPVRKRVSRRRTN